MNNALTKWRLMVAIILAWVGLLAGVTVYGQEGGTPITVTGRLDVQIIENFNPTTSTMAYWLQADTGPVYELQFSGSPLEALKTGQWATVQGIAGGNQLRVATITLQAPDQAMPTAQGSTMSPDAAMEPACPTVQRRAVVLLVNLQDAQVSTPTQQIADIMYSTTARSVRDFYLQNSFGQFDFVPDSNNDGAPDVFGPYSINYNYNYPNPCNYYAWAAAAEAAAQSAGIDLSPYQHRIFILPPRNANASCQWSGIANVACSSGNPCRLWITDATIPIVYVHELGHNLGLMHAGADSDNDGLINSSDEYADWSDPMGNSPYWHLFSAPNMDRMGWYVPYSGNITTVTGSGTYTLDVLDATLPVIHSSIPRIIRLYWPRNKPGYYYLSYRQPVGYDASMADPYSQGYKYTQGVNIHWSQDPAAGPYPTGFVTSLTDGATFTDSAAGIQVTQLGYSNNSVTVSIVQPSNRTPFVNVTSPTDGAAYYPDQSITFTGTAADVEDGDLTASLTWTSDLDGVIGRHGTFTRKLSTGYHTITAGVTDSGGLSRSTTLTVNVQPNAAPIVNIATPANNATLITDQAISFFGVAYDVHDGDRSSSLTWTSSLDGPIGMGQSFTRTLSIGNHVISAQAADSTGLVGSAAISISVVGNIAPTVTVTAPADGATFTTDQAITFTGTASDPQDGNLTASLSWTSSIDGAIGSGGSFTRTLSVGNHTIQAQVTDNKGATSTATLTVHVINPTTATFTSVGAEDGWVLESGENTNVGGSIKASDSTSSGLMLGDSSKKYQYKSILSFDTASLPDNATITSATLRLQRGTLVGASFCTSPNCSLLADIKAGGFNDNMALEKADFQAVATATGVATLSAAASNGAWSQGTLNANGLTALNKTGKTQFRLYFTLDDDNDSTADYVGYYAGEYATAASRPQLVVNYVVNTAPVVTIAAPANNTQVAPGTPITFSGIASDAEDGNLNTRLVWTSNLDGRIGTGGSFTTTALREGIHTITATVTDGFGAQAAASITLIDSTNHPPTVTISSPANGAGFIDGDVIHLSGTATDVDDGDLSFAMVWTSNIDGELCRNPVCNRILSIGTHIIQAQAYDSGGFSGKATVTITVSPPPTVTLNSIGAEDGWVLESGENTNAGGSIKSSDSTSSGLMLGDSSKKYQYKSILSFDTSAIPANATLLSATLRLQRGTLVGANFCTSTTCSLLADIKTGGFNGNNALETTDFQAVATATGVVTLGNAASNGAWSEGAVNASGLAAINRTGRTQFRLYFSVDDDNDSIADYVGYYAGEYATAASRPQLVVTYR